jgi:hypothetical protein
MTIGMGVGVGIGGCGVGEGGTGVAVGGTGVSVGAASEVTGLEGRRVGRGVVTEAALLDEDEESSLLQAVSARAAARRMMGMAKRAAGSRDIRASRSYRSHSRQVVKQTYSGLTVRIRGFAIIRVNLLPMATCRARRAQKRQGSGA